MSYTKTQWVDNTTPINEINLNKIEQGIKNNDINIGEENYDNTKTYEVGDIVRYNEKIYKCITAITTAENFDISKWEQTNIVEIVQSEKSKIYELIEAISTPIVGEGENITLNDTAEKRFENFDIEGNSEQEATPSPDYPSEVKSCGDNINIFDLESYYNIVPSANCTKQLLKNGIRLNFTAGNDAYIGGVYNIGTTMAENQKAACIKVKPNTTYTLKMSSAPSCYMSFLDKDYKAVKAFVNISSNEYVFSTDSSTEYIYLRLGYHNRTSGLTSYDFTDIKCVEGTEVGEYSKYGQGCINEVICNKNLVNVGENSYSTMGLNITLDKSRIKINGTPTSNDYILKKDDINAIYLGKFKKGTYYMTRQQFSGFTKKGSGFSVQIRKDVWSGTAIANYGMETTLQQKKIILDEDVDLYLTMWANKDDIYNNVEFLFSIYSDTDVNHVQHQEQSYTIPTQQPMRAIGDTRDKFILKENGKWYERHYIARKIFDGTENFNLGTNANSLIYFFTNAGSIKAKSQDLLCNKLTTVTNLWNETENKNLIAIRSSLDLFNIMLSDTTINTVEKFKSWLSEQYNAGTPVYVDYVLATPTDIECTSEQTEILNQIYIKAKSYKGVTHIYSNDDVSPNCYVEAVKDLTTLIQ